MTKVKTTTIKNEKVRNKEFNLRKTKTQKKTEKKTEKSKHSKQFSKCFHWHTLQTIYNNVIIIYPSKR